MGTAAPNTIQNNSGLAQGLSGSLRPGWACGKRTGGGPRRVRGSPMSDVRRREFVTLLGGAAATWPLAARAQQAKGTRRIGMLLSRPQNHPQWQAPMTAFRQRLQQLGWAVGQNLQIDYRWASDLNRIRTFAAELVSLAPDVLFTMNTPSVLAMHDKTNAIPIVFAIVTDQLAVG